MHMCLSVCVFLPIDLFPVVAFIPAYSSLPPHPHLPIRPTTPIPLVPVLYSWSERNLGVCEAHSQHNCKCLAREPSQYQTLSGKCESPCNWGSCTCAESVCSKCSAGSKGMLVFCWSLTDGDCPWIRCFNWCLIQGQLPSVKPKASIVQDTSTIPSHSGSFKV